MKTGNMAALLKGPVQDPCIFWLSHGRSHSMLLPGPMHFLHFRGRDKLSRNCLAILGSQHDNETWTFTDCSTAKTSLIRCSAWKDLRIQELMRELAKIKKEREEEEEAKKVRLSAQRPLV